MQEDENRKYVSEASDRNKGPILDVLREVLPASGYVLEISSGTGQHAVHMAEAYPGITWQPSDIDPDFRNSVEAWRAESGLTNILPSIHLDVTEHPWPVEHADAIFNCNMIHIAPWECCIGLLEGASKILPDGGILYMYGPYKVGGRHTAPSNEAFDQNLRGRDPSWGIRNLDDVALEARRRGLHLIKTVKMPANNFSVIYRKTAMEELGDA
jgi:SAM-dependent methyltransferase